MRTPIDQLEENLWAYCVMQRPPRDQKMAERWHSDDLAHLKERFVIQPMPESLVPLVEKAMSQWKAIETEIFSKMQMEREEFLKEFEKAREDFLSGNKGWKGFVASVGSRVRGVVRNMDWVNLFSWILPNADPENRQKHKTVGRVVASIFYMELLWKHYMFPDEASEEALVRIEARWKLATQD